MPVTKTPKASDADFEAYVGKIFDDDIEFPAAVNKRVDAKFFLKPVQDMVLEIRDSMIAGNQVLPIRNNLGFTLLRGTSVYVSGFDATNNRHEVTRALATANSTLAEYVIKADLATATNGLVYAYRKVTGIAGQPVDTSGRTKGDAVYLSAAVAGEFVFTAPTAPNISQQIGIVEVVDAILGQILFLPGGLFGGNKAGASAVSSFPLNILEVRSFF